MIEVAISRGSCTGQRVVRRSCAERVAAYDEATQAFPTATMDADFLSIK